MDAVEQVRRLLAYDAWANGEALGALRAVGEPPARAVRIMGHIVAVEWVWLSRLGVVPPGVPVWPDWDLAECARQLERLPEPWQPYLERLDARELERVATYTNSKGEAWTNKAGDILLHVATHSGYHRGQVALLMGGAGQQPAYTDYIEGVRRGLVGGK